MNFHVSCHTVPYKSFAHLLDINVELIYNTPMNKKRKTSVTFKTFARRIWSINPVERVKPSGKVYKRNKQKAFDKNSD